MAIIVVSIDQEISSVRGSSRSTPQLTASVCIPTRWDDWQILTSYFLQCDVDSLIACGPTLSISQAKSSFVFVLPRRSWLLETRVAWFTSGIWRPTTTSSSSRSPRSRSTPSTSTQMPVTWRQSTARWAQRHSTSGAILFFHCKSQTDWGASSFFLLALVLPGQLLRVEPCRRNRRGGDSDDPQDQDPCTQPLLPPLQV